MGAGMGGGGETGSSTGNVPNFGGFQSIFHGGTNNPLGLTIPQSSPLSDTSIMLNAASGADVLQGGSGNSMYPGLIQPGLIQ